MQPAGGSFHRDRSGSGHDYPEHYRGRYYLSMLAGFVFKQRTKEYGLYGILGLEAPPPTPSLYGLKSTVFSGLSAPSWDCQWRPGQPPHPGSLSTVMEFGPGIRYQVPAPIRVDLSGF